MGPTMHDMQLRQQPCRAAAGTGFAERLAWPIMRRHQSTQQPARSCRSSLVCRAGLLSSEPSGKTPWYSKNKELWLELRSLAEHKRAQTTLPPGKLLVVDYYASWCRVAALPEYTDHFVFAKANIEEEEMKTLIKDEGIIGIPWMSVYRPTGKVIGFGASFKKLEIIRSNLLVIAANKDADFQPDPNGFLIVKGQVANATAP